jgi:hypothetical protein
MFHGHFSGVRRVCAGAASREPVSALPEDVRRVQWSYVNEKPLILVCATIQAYVKKLVLAVADLMRGAEVGCPY